MRTQTQAQAQFAHVHSNALFEPSSPIGQPVPVPVPALSTPPHFSLPSPLQPLSNQFPFSRPQFTFPPISTPQRALQSQLSIPANQCSSAMADLPSLISPPPAFSNPNHNAAAHLPVQMAVPLPLPGVRQQPTFTRQFSYDSGISNMSVSLERSFSTAAAASAGPFNG